MLRSSGHDRQPILDRLGLDEQPRDVARQQVPIGNVRGPPASSPSAARAAKTGRETTPEIVVSRIVWFSQHTCLG